MKRDLEKILNLASRFPVRYADVKFLTQSAVEVALRTDSCDVSRERSSWLVCRVINEEGGYGVASSSGPGEAPLEEIFKLAYRCAAASKEAVRLGRAKVEEGSVEHKKKKDFDVEEAMELLEGLKAEVEGESSGVKSEMVAASFDSDYEFLTSEGTRIEEKASFVDLTVYAIAKEGFASKVVGGRGGWEIVEGQRWGEIVEELKARLKDSGRARALTSPGKFNAVLDGEASGALAHELTHFLEADVHRRAFFVGPDRAGFELVDDPTLKGGYGSFNWDDEGVKAVKKILVGGGGVRLLHTRLTVGEGDYPGNARGVFHKPRPTLSNAYVKPGDWGVGEILEETKHGLYLRGIVRAECDLQDGRIELQPEIAYRLERGELKEPIKHLRIVCNVKDLLRSVDAVGRDFALRPSLEKGNRASEGGPHLRISRIAAY